MKEVPNQDIIHMDQRISVPEKVESEITPQDPFFVWLLFSEFEKLTSIDVEGKKALDLGSGHGTALAVGESIGMKMYGLEKRADMVSISRAELKRAGFHPQVKHIDYFSPEMTELRFDDGARVRDMDFFYLFAYEGSIYEEEGCHAVKVINDVFLKDFVSPDSFLLITPNPEKSDEWYAERPLDRIRDDAYELIIKKRKKIKTYSSFPSIS